MDHKELCTLCPRKCLADRVDNLGVCQEKREMKVARAALHMWEEPCISGKNGSGAIFFSGCSLRCVYCQNKKISKDNFGKQVTPAKLAQIMLRLQSEGAANIDLVTPTHFSPLIKESLKMVKGELNIPVIYNTSGYENEDVIEGLRGYIDVFLPDYKYKGKFLSRKLSNAVDYPEKAAAAIEKMVDITGPCKFDANGMILKGTIIRHLVLPGFLENTYAVLDDIAKRFKDKGVLISLMGQYTPCYYEGETESLKRPLNEVEYQQAVDHACYLGLDGFMQDLSSADRKYTPNFDLEGL